MGRPAGAAAGPRPDPARAPRAVILSGSLGMGHDVLAEIVAGSLARLGWQSRTLDCMGMLGPRAGRAGDWVFRGLTTVPGVYDALHFAQLRAGSRLAAAMDRAATPGWSPRSAAELARRARRPDHRRVRGRGPGRGASSPRAGPRRAGRRALPRRPAARDLGPRRHRPVPGHLRRGGRRVHRYAPGARVAVVPPPVRAAFSHPLAAGRGPRRRWGYRPDARCVLLMGGGWGLGPVEEAARALAAAGVHVLAVAGHNRRLAARLEALAATSPRVHPYGFTPRIAELMSACDLVVTLPGALTCGEARAVGRRLMLLDAMPGHGRENLQHELELGGAEACNPRPAGDRRAASWPPWTGPGPASGRPGRPADWDQAFAAALASIGAGPEHEPGTAAGPGRGRRPAGSAVIRTTIPPGRWAIR